MDEQVCKLRPSVSKFESYDKHVIIAIMTVTVKKQALQKLEIPLRQRLCQPSFEGL